MAAPKSVLPNPKHETEMKRLGKEKLTVRNAGFSNEIALKLICLLYPVGITGWFLWLARSNVAMKPMGGANPSIGLNSMNGEATSSQRIQKQAAYSGSNGISTWAACQIDVNQSGPPPQPGETWWPVVGPVDSLDDARQYCRADAYINRSGHVQVASFRDKSIAEEFANAISANSNGRHRFWLGEPSYR